MKNELDKIIKILKVLLGVDDIDVIKCTIESLIEELEEKQNEETDD